MSLEARLRALEAMFADKSIVLTMLDGTKRNVPGDDLLEMFCAGMHTVYEWGLTHEYGTAIPVAEFGNVDPRLVVIMESAPTYGEEPMIGLIRDFQLGKEN